MYFPKLTLAVKIIFFQYERKQQFRIFEGVVSPINDGRRDRKYCPNDTPHVSLMLA